MTSRVGLSRWLAAVCGLLAAAVALGIAQLLAGISAPNASPADAVGSVVINHTPLSVKVWATSTFGTNDKTVLLTGVFIVVFVYAMVVGVLAARRMAYGFVGLALFAALGIAAAVTTHGASPGYALPTVFGALVGAFALYRLIESARAMSAARAARPATTRGRRATGALPPIVFGTSAAGGDDDGDQADSGAKSGATSGAEPDDGLRAPDLPRGWYGSGETGPTPTPDSPPAPAGGTGAGAGRPPVRPTPGRPTPLQPAAGQPAWAAGGGTSGRRSFLVTAGVTVAAAAVTELGGRNFATRKNVSAAQAAIRFPKAAVPAPPLPAGVNLPVPGISPFFTPNGTSTGWTPR